MPEKPKNRWLQIIGVGLFIFFSILFVGVIWGMRIEKYEVEIPQDIGGKILCKVQYGCDQHGCETLIEYNMVSENGEVTRIGYGGVDGEDWDRNIQIQRVQNLLLINTESRKLAGLFIGDSHAAKWSEYSFSPDTINSSSVWKSSGIKSLPNYSYYTETTISEIKKNGEVIVVYKFVINENRDTDKRLLVYKINSDGEPQLKEIKAMEASD